MAAITWRGTWVPPGASRKTAGCPLTVCARAGNCERTQVRSSLVEEAGSAMSIADILMEEARESVWWRGFAPPRRGEPRLYRRAAVRVRRRVREEWVAWFFPCWRRPDGCGSLAPSPGVSHRWPRFHLLPSRNLRLGRSAEHP